MAKAMTSGERAGILCLLGEQLVEAVRESGLLKPKRRKMARRKRRTARPSKRTVEPTAKRSKTKATPPRETNGRDDEVYDED